MRLLLLSLPLVLKAALSTVPFGCKTYDGTTCTKFCPYGYADCSASPIVLCEHGFFRFTDPQTNEQTCLLCPFQLFSDALTLYCQDCYSNPYTWERNRTCSYNYRILNGNPATGVYVQTKTDPQLYYIGPALSSIPPQINPVREINIKYEAFQCEGCGQFCDADQSEGCYQIDFDQQFTFVKCEKGSYFKDGFCLDCPLNCNECESTENCLTCADGYYKTAETSGQCDQCPHNCLKCFYQESEEGGAPLCVQCKINQYIEYHVPSPEQDYCTTCPISCARCEFIIYSGTGNSYLTRNEVQGDQSTAILRCRQCISQNQFISYRGLDCDECYIDNCQECYQEIKKDGQVKWTTLDLDFTPLSDPAGYQITLKCQRCKPGYKFNPANNACETLTPSAGCDVEDALGNCLHCQGNKVLDKIQTPHTCGSVECSKKLDNCLACFSFLKPGQAFVDDEGNPQSLVEPSYRCITCDSGYYPDITSGMCVKCPQNCATCWQYTQSYNFTYYTQTQQIPTPDQLNLWLREPMQDLMCSTCNIGFDLYNNVCMGCTGNCYSLEAGSDTSTLDVCEFRDTLAFCSQCIDPQEQRSLNDEMSECQDCPDYCLACRSRVPSEMESNPEFNPTSFLLQKYGKLCYKLKGGLTNIFIDTQLGLPVKCPNSYQNGLKCYNKQTIKVYVGIKQPVPLPADGNFYLVSKFFPKQSAFGTIKFIKDDSYATYKLLNENAVRELDFTIILLSEGNGAGELSDENIAFSKPANLTLDFLRNVFSLQKVTLTIKAQTTPQYLLQMHGIVNIRGATVINMENLHMMYLQQRKQTHKEWGFIIQSKAETQVLFKKVKFSGVQFSSISLRLVIDNPTLISCQETEFHFLNPNDQLIVARYSKNVRLQEVILDTVVLFSPNLKNRDFIMFEERSQNMKLTIRGLKIEGGESEQILNSTLVKSMSVNSKLVYLIEKVQIFFLRITNSVLFNLGNQLSGSIKEFDVLQSELIRSKLFLLNHVNLNSIYVESTFIRSGSVLIQTQIEAVNVGISDSLKAFSLIKLNMMNCRCEGKNCFALLQTPKNALDIFATLTVQDIQVMNTRTSEISDDEYKLVQSALFSFSIMKALSMDNIFISDTRAITIFYASEIAEVKISKVSYDWNNKNIIISPLNGKQIKNPDNNLIPTSQDCTTRKTNTRTFTFYLFYIRKFKLGVSIFNLRVQRQLTIDSSIVFLESYSFQEINTTTATSSEYITMDTVLFYNNSLTSNLVGAQMSMIMIKSSQIQQITLTNFFLESNHLHVIAKQQTADINALIQINSPLATTTIRKMLSNFNRATNSERGLIYIKCTSIYLSDSRFNYTNKLDYQWLNRFEEYQLQNDDQIKSFLEIRSQGAIFDLQIQVGTFTNNVYANSYGVQAGIRITTIEQAFLSLKNETYTQIHSSLQLKYASNGGALYIDSTLSSLTLEIIDTKMINCAARVNGGCIFLIGSNQRSKISITGSIFDNCLAIENSFMMVRFEQSDQPSQTFITNVEIKNNNMSWFLSNVPDIQQQDLISLATVSSVYTQLFGEILMTSVNLYSHSLTSIIRLIDMSAVQLSNLNIYNNVIFVNPLITIKLLEETKAKITIADLKFINITEVDGTMGIADCKDQMKRDTTYISVSQNCDVIQQNAEMLDELDDSDEIYEIKDLTKLNHYNLLSSTGQKYTLGYMSFPKFETLFQPYNEFVALSQRLVDCLLTAVLFVIESLNLEQHTSFLNIPIVQTQHTLLIQALQFTQNVCKKCTGGLGQFRKMMQSPNQQRVQIVDFLCQSNIIGYYGCLTFIDDTFPGFISIPAGIVDKPINDSTISKGRFLQVSVRSQDHTVLIEQSKFKENRAKAGTCIYAKGITIVVLNSQFTDNQAALAGGAIFFSNSSYNDLFVQSNIFTGNEAQVGGGIFLQDYTLGSTENLGIQFDYNKADQGGQNLQELTQRMTILMGNTPFAVSTYMNASGDHDGDGKIDNSSVIIKENITVTPNKIGAFEYLTTYLVLPSGQPINFYKYFYEYTQEQVDFEWIFRIQNLNRQGDIVNNGNSTHSCIIEGRIQREGNYSDEIAFTNNFTKPNKVFYDDSKGGYDMDTLIVIFDPYFRKELYLELKFVCPATRIPVYNTVPPYQILGFNPNYQFFARVKTFPCQKGEIYDAQQCKPCLQSDNAYSIVKKSQICQQLDRAYMSAVTPTGVKLLPGMWRPNYDNNQYQYCSNLPANCKGGWVPGNPSCYEGHLGGLCESCDIYTTIYEESWANSAPYVCGKCAETRQLNIIIIIATSIVTLFSVISSVKGTYEQLQLQIVEEIISKIGYRLKSDASNLATVIKTLTNYFQIVQIVGTFQLSLPEAVTNTASTAGNPTGSMASNLDCLLVDLTDVTIVYFKMIWALVMPSIYLVIFLIGYFSIVVGGVTKYQAAVVYTAFIYMFLYLHPTLVQGFISLASSRTISGDPYVKADVAYRYDSAMHTIWMNRFIFPMLGLWVLILPLLFMFLVWRKRKHLNEKETKMRLGYFYKEYSKDSYLWEFVKIFQKEFMVIILVYYEEQVIVKGLLIVLVLFLYGSYQISVTPYTSTDLNLTDRYSTLVCGGTLALGVLMYASLRAGFDYLVIIILVIILVMNLWFILRCVLSIFQGYLIQLSDVLDKVRDKINEKYPIWQYHKKYGRYLKNQGKLKARVKTLWDGLKSKIKLADKLYRMHKHIDLDYEDALDLVCQHIKEHNITEHELQLENKEVGPNEVILEEKQTLKHSEKK